MCLISKEKEPSTSTYNIQCYKILIPVSGKLFTPYRDFCFAIGETIVDEVKESPLEAFGVFIIEGGYFHSYKTLKQAKKKVQELEKRAPKGTILKIYNAEIPTGTKFYDGYYDDLCSKALKIIDECCD